MDAMHLVQIKGTRDEGAPLQTLRFDARDVAILVPKSLP